jgi:anti-sigma factor RsiW
MARFTERRRERMTCEEIQNSLDRFLDGEIADAGREQMVAHLETCSTCRQQREGLLHLEQLVGAAAVDPLPRDFKARVVQQAAAARPRTVRARLGAAARRWADACGSSVRWMSSHFRKGRIATMASFCPNCLDDLGKNRLKCDYCRMYYQGLQSAQRTAAGRRWAFPAAALALSLGCLAGYELARRPAEPITQRPPTRSTVVVTPPVTPSTPPAQPPAPIPAYLEGRGFLGIQQVYADPTGEKKKAWLNRFTVHGPDEAATPVDASVDLMVRDATSGTIYALSNEQYNVGTLEAPKKPGQPLHYQPIAGGIWAPRDVKGGKLLDPPNALAFDTRRRSLIVATENSSLTGTNFYEYQAASAQPGWKALAKVSSLKQVMGMTYHSGQNVFYAVEHRLEDNLNVGYLLKLSATFDILSTTKLKLPGIFTSTLGFDWFVQLADLAVPGRVVLGIHYMNSIRRPDGNTIIGSARHCAAVDANTGNVLSNTFYLPKFEANTIMTAANMPADTELHMLSYSTPRSEMNPLPGEKPLMPQVMNVTISRKDKPLVLVLAGPGWVSWKLDVMPGVKLMQVLVHSGPVSSDPKSAESRVPVAGVDPLKVVYLPRMTQIPAINDSAFSFPVEKDPVYYQKMVAWLAEMTRMPIFFFQGSSDGAYHFTVDSSSEPAPLPPQGAELHVVTADEAGPLIEKPLAPRLRTRREVVLAVKRTGHPLVLALNGFWPTRWRIVPSPGVQIERIILSGTDFQEVVGVPETTRVLHKTRNWHDGLYFSIPFDLERSQSQWPEALRNLKELTGLNPTTQQAFTGESADKFIIR